MLGIISAGVAPALALMSFFYLKDKITEPIPLIIRTFIYGCLLVFPIMFIQYAFTSDQIGNLFVQAFFVVAFLEEFFKWFIFLYVIFQHTEFDAHYDGIVYAVSISLGFATIENILYLFVNGIEYAFSRAIFPVSSHALFGVIMGYYFGKAKMNSENRILNIALALVIPITLHGLYNFILGSVEENWASFVIPFMIILWFFGLHRMKIASAN
ncbi:glutamic-type intramembrane protease PrsW [Paucisalibacillus globulus]|uniref:glutamic-type intramembrane protease PrsW n=1 Tax=Paucisalibacillus globulus TaxID=351095 RepID=UPI00040090D1|nr:glutamic-type intramembrane protease PrsW [Paucisalibacillus globulus]